MAAEIATRECHPEHRPSITVWFQAPVADVPDIEVEPICGCAAVSTRVNPLSPMDAGFTRTSALVHFDGSRVSCRCGTVVRIGFMFDECEAHT